MLLVLKGMGSNPNVTKYFFLLPVFNHGNLVAMVLLGSEKKMETKPDKNNFICIIH